MIEIGTDFSGVGAFEQALLRLGIDYKTIFACDMDKYARQTYIANYGEPKYFPEDVYDRIIPKKSLGIYVTTPPCQGFSLAGKRGGSILFLNSHQFIQINKPRYFIFENVKGLLSHDKRNKKAQYGNTFNEWINYLGGKSVNGNPVIFPHQESVPYHIYFKVINAKNCGVPQNRERVFIVGIRDDCDNNFTWPKDIHLTKRLKDVLESDVDEKYYLSDKMLNYLLKNSENMKLKGNGFSFKPKNENSISNSVTTKSGQRMDDNFLKVKSATKKGFEVAQTLDTACNQAVMIGAIRGRNPEQPTSRETGLLTKQMLELNLNGTSNALTTVQKDNVVVQLNPSKESGGKQPYQGNRIYDDKGISPTLQAQNGGFSKGSITIKKSNDYRIRRLTPRECFRLMDFPDTFKIDQVSNTQAYRQAGNSIVISCLVSIIKKLNL